MTSRQRTLCYAGLLVTSMLLVPAAMGHFDRPWYTYGDSGCEHREDPINVIFYGTAATNHHVFEHTIRHTGWQETGGDLNGGDQYIKDRHTGCARNYEQIASGSGSRFHVRFFGNPHKDDKGRWETSADPHHEDLVAPPQCFPAGHAVDKGTKEEPTENGSGFDWGRRELDAQYYSPHHHPVYYERGKNTRSFEQCDGDEAGSNGTIAWIRVGHRYP